MTIIYLQFWLLLLKSVFSHATDNTTTTTTTAMQRRNGVSAKTRIVKGFPCSTETYPFAVRITESKENTTQWSGLCGGTLIAPLWVLTAAHCMAKGGIFVVTAAFNNPEGKPLELEVEDILIHPEFDPDTFSCDIALMKLKYSVERSEHVDYVELPKSEYPSNVPPCETGIIMGWGTTGSYGVTQAKKLRCAKVPVISTQDCLSIFVQTHGIRIWPDQICAVSSKGVDSCQGDSGGPLLCDSVQVGIISWGIQCGIPNSPGVYTRTDSHLDFIKKNVFGSSGDIVRICFSFILSQFLVITVIAT